MAQYIKILLLFLLVLTPALDAAGLDAPADAALSSLVLHDDGSDPAADIDVHCVCHVLHHGLIAHPVTAMSKIQPRFKAAPFVNTAASGLQPQPVTPPPLA